jgi:O-antigen/teichoic acid export membrane protein
MIGADAVTGTKASDLGGILKRLVANTGLLIGGRAGNAVLGLGYMALAGRSLGVQTLGLLVLIHAFAQLIGEIAKFQSWQCVMQFAAKPLAEGRRGDFQKALRFTLGLDAIGATLGPAAAMIGAVIFADRLGWGRAHAADAAIYMIVVLSMVITTPVGLMRLLDRFDVLAAQTVIVSAVRLAGCAIGFVLRAPLEGFLLAWGLGQMAGFAYLCWMTWRELHRRGLMSGFTLGGGKLDAGLTGAWGFAWNTHISATLDAGLTHVATLGVGALLGPSAAALWKVGRQIADAIAKPAKLLAQPLYPELARLRAVNNEGMMMKVVGRVSMIAGAVAGLLLVASLFAGPSLLHLVMGKAFVAAAPVMRWQLAAVTLAVLVLPMEPMMISLGRAGWVVCVQAVALAAFVGVLYALAEPLGLIGAGAALVAANVVLGGGLLLALSIHNGWRPRVPVLTPAMAPAE